ncbi:hypothetical protein QR680_010751 [Steinernema hermaphroditum]|uniref:NADP-dependent oxidoreductase domain-containing protein n=1 Tax=Steinernema hermaphroditum TaxID=289476 RepID=A0AA39IQ02_9BILA|nr:hypothetical protein QR680_010751 [Steinernema hermaphroditum]
MSADDDGAMSRPMAAEMLAGRKRNCPFVMVALQNITMVKIAVPSVKLPTGAEMPLLGLGTWQGTSEELQSALRIALDAGYRLIDTAKCYENESDIGVVLHEYISSGKIKREELFVTTKLWCTHNRPDEVENEIKESLKRLQLDYVDLYLVHMPVAFNNDMSEQLGDVKVEDTWRGMEGVFEKGLAKAIGVSNFNIEQIERIQKVAKVPIHNVQVEAYLYFPQFELQEVCNKHNITFTAYAPVGSPGRFNFKLAKFEEAPSPFENETVKKLSEKYGKTPAQILLRHLVQRNISVIPKSTNEKRLKENFDILEFELAEEEVKELNDVKHRQRLFHQEFLAGHPEDPFKTERVAA